MTGAGAWGPGRKDQRIWRTKLTPEQREGMSAKCAKYDHKACNGWRLSKREWSTGFIGQQRLQCTCPCHQGET